MKPPSRHRILPARLLDIKKTEPVRRFRPRCHRLEQRNLLLALKQQKGINKELDYLELQKKIPKWSVLQIQNVIKYLRRGVVHRVYLQVQKERQEERKTKKPTEIWAELAHRMAGVHEETISFAFSQMLVIAATEPCSLCHSDPPRTADSHIPLASGMRTIPQRLMPKFQPNLSGQACKTPQLHGKDAAGSSSAQTTTVTSPPAVAEGECSELQKTEAHKDPALPSISASPESPLIQPASKPALSPASASSAVSTPALSHTSDTDHPDKQSESGQSEKAWQYTPLGGKSVVDFEKIYQFMANIVLEKHTQPLTAMESAVLLDLLMSLPEELPLLDCKELQHHLLQVYTPLNTPAVSLGTDQGPAVASYVVTNVTEQQTSRAGQHTEGSGVSVKTQCAQSIEQEPVKKGTVTEQVTAGDFPGQSPAVNLLKGEGDWATVGLCPLNPFIVPIALLKRQEPKQSKTSSSTLIQNQ
ncbi:snRNA-activating protein complex subunit 2 [Clarias gariepinus]|uniref:snRNA-activating protein complex subunit 2 n=1 Tax=Clarias gariepinus TaxID=13013 RepID=UPI00234CA6BD|nr:snRNA-activating protein complex subunit 2 [Clarias gariepinus]